MINQPNIEPISKRKYMLEEKGGWSYVWTQKHNGIDRRHKIRVPEGFIFDGNSAPSVTWSFFGILPDGLNRAAGLVHDFIYQHFGNLPIDCYLVEIGDRWYPKAEKIERDQADKLYLQILNESKYHKPNFAYYGVRLGGWWPWYVKRWLKS